MSACSTFTCSHCGFGIDAWEDGNRYVEDVRGERHFWYHPAHHGPDAFVAELLSKGIEPAVVAGGGGQEVVRFVGGNESDYLCMNCGEECRRDPWRDPVVCAKCGQRKLRLTMRLLGRRCPRCKEGRFGGGDVVAVS